MPRTRRNVEEASAGALAVLDVDPIADATMP